MNPLDYDLNTEYRNRQMNRAERAASIKQVSSKKAQPLSFHAVTNISMIWIIASIMALVLFLAASPSQAQSTVFSEGEDGGNSDAVYLYLIGAIEAIQVEDFDAALTLLDAASESNENFAPAYISRSFIALAQDDAEAALIQAEIAYTLNPADAAVYFVLAESHFMLGNFDDAITHYQSYLAMLEEAGYQPVLITSLLNDSSLPLVTEHLDNCQTQIAA